MPADFRTQIENLRPYLLRYATLQLRNPEAAEDAVQEALLAALAGEANFAGRSNLRTWLTGILKHKIVDTIRRQSKERPLAGTDSDGDIAEFDTLFDETGHWAEPPVPGSSRKGPRAEAVPRCARAVPARAARAHSAGLHDARAPGLDTSEICKELAITSTHLWVMLYRARMALRLCLQMNWFNK